MRQRVRQLICDSLSGMRLIQTILTAAIHTPERDTGSLEDRAAESWSLGIVGQSHGKGCC